MRRFQAAGLALALVAGTIGATFALVRAVGSGNGGRLGSTGPMPVPAGNGLIAYTSRQSGNYDIWTTRPDGTHPHNITAESHADETDAAWSPDGSKVAFVSNRDGDNDIYVTDPKGTEVSHLTDEPGNEYSPAWSPDGKKIAYSADGNLFLVNADGSLPTRLTTPARHAEHHTPTWAPDGARIAFLWYTLSEPEDGFPGPIQFFTGSGISVVALDGGVLTPLTVSPLDPDIHSDGPPDWSPDGRKILFGRGGEIQVMNADGSGLTALTQGGDPAWSPDGRRIVFTGQHSTGAEFPYLQVMSADGSHSIRLGASRFLEGGGADWQPVPAAAGAPTSAPSQLPPECDASQVIGNFDGDGQPDTATVARTNCLMNTGDLENSRSSEYSLMVRWPPAEAIAPLPSCLTACRAVAAADLNGDEIDEFILSASSTLFLVYELPANEAFGRPATVAPPGAPSQWAADRPAELRLFSSQFHYDTFGCDFIKERVTVLKIALKPDQGVWGQWEVHETLLQFETIPTTPFGQFAVISERDYSEPGEEGIGAADKFDAGGPCWE